MNTAREFINDMAEHISLPFIYQELRALIANPQASISDFVDVIESDSMLSVRIIRISRSEFFGFPRNTENLYQAISLIGVMQLHDILLSCLCMRAFSSLPPQIINMRDFWTYSVQCGIAARTIAKHSAQVSTNQFFTLGILHEIGHAAMYIKAPEQMIQVLEEDRAQNGSTIEIEREILGFDYNQLGAEMMRLWQLPEAYRQVAAYHLNPRQADELYRSTVEVVHLAHDFCQHLVAGQHREQIEASIDNNPRLKHLPRNIDELVIADIEAHTDSVMAMLWPCGVQELHDLSEAALYE